MNYTRVLSFLPYPYRFSIESNIYAQQTYGSNLNSFDSWSWLFGTKYKKSFYSLYYSHGISKLLLKHFIWSKISDIMIRTGLVSTQTPKSSVAQNIINDQLRLLKIRYEIETITTEREKVLQLFTNITENEDEDEETELEASPEEIQSILDKLGSDLSKLNEEKALIKEKIKQKRQTSKNNLKINQTNSQDEQQSSILSDRLAEWGIGILSTVITESLLYPFEMIEIWMYVQQQDCSLLNASVNLLNSIRHQNKNPYDGFLIHCFSTVSQGILIYPSMKVMKKIFDIPDESQLQKSMRTLLSLFSSEDPFEEDEDDEYEWSNMEKKREIVKSFRSVMKNTFAYSLSNWFSQCLLYPFFTCRTLYASQGSSYLAPLKFSSTASVFRCLNKRGFSSYFSGFSLQVLSVCLFSLEIKMFFFNLSLLIYFFEKDCS